MSRVEIGANGGAETSSGGRGSSERTSEEQNGYAERNAALVQTAQRGCKYKMIQNGIDEYKWWIEEAIEHGEPSEPVTLKRGGRTVREKTVLPTAESILGLWIEQFVEGGRNCIPNLVWIESGTDATSQVRRRD